MQQVGPNGPTLGPLKVNEQTNDEDDDDDDDGDGDGEGNCYNYRTD